MSETRTPVGDVTTKVPDGVPTTVVRVGNELEAITSQMNGRLWELAKRGQLFFACSQAATTTTVALNSTYTGLCLSNPAASGKILQPHRVGIALSVAPAAEATISLAGGYAAAGIVTHSTPLVVYNTKLGTSAASAVAKADAAATLVGTELDIMPLLGSGETGAETFGPGLFNIDGAVCIPPGAYVFIETLTVAVGFFGIWWSEHTE